MLKAVAQNDRLLDVNSPALDTIKMQMFFDSIYCSRGML